MCMYIAFKTIVTGLVGAGLVCTFDSMNLGHNSACVYAKIELARERLDIVL